MAVQFGLDTFGELQVDTNDDFISHAQSIRNVVEQAVRAEEVGFDVFGIGEHHREDYAISAPDMVLANIAARTSKIHLTTSVIVLSSDDPVRVFERFSSLQALSGGRAEVQLGRGSFTESFPLFGYDLADYEKLFEEKLDLMRAILDADASHSPLSWSGTTRAALDDVTLYPPLEAPLPTWAAVGGSPESVVRAARQKMNLMLAIIGGAPARFKPFVDLYHHTNEELGQPARPVGAHFPGLVAATDQEAMDRVYPYWHHARTLVGRSRGWPAPTPEDFVNEVRHGALHLGSPETVAQKTARSIQALGLDRVAYKYSLGPVPHEYLMESIELMGEQVIPRVREILAGE